MRTMCFLRDPFSARTVFALVVLLCSGDWCAALAQSGIYVGGHFRRDRAHAVNDLKASGFTYAILFSVDVAADGSLSMDGEPMVSNGSYIFGAVQPNYPSDVASLKRGISSIRRVETCIGGWGNSSFGNIKNLIAAQGTGSGSILYRNFAALKEAVPDIDAINFDDESTYDVNSSTAFAVMLRDVGFKVTLAPYTNAGYWKSVAANTNSQRPGTVDRIDLQCYDGGKPNNPADWNFNGIPLNAGLWQFDAASTVRSSMTNWRDNASVKGGFIWIFNEGAPWMPEYAGVINDVFGEPRKKVMESVNCFKNSDQGLFTNGLPVGDYTKAQLQDLGVADNDISSMTIAEGFEVEAYDGDDFSGDTKVFSAGTINYVGADWNDRITSLSVRTSGEENLAGTWYLQNRVSGLYLVISDSGMADGVQAIQSEKTGGLNQQFECVHLGEGVYKIIAKHSGRVLDIDGIKQTNGAKVQQWAYYGTPNQQFVMVDAGDGYYKLVAKHCGKIVEVGNALTTAGATVNLWANNNQECGMWKPVPVASTPVSVPDNALIGRSVSLRGSLLALSGFSPQAEVGILNASGRLIRSARGSLVDVSGLGAGSYFVNVVDRGASTLVRILKQ